MTPAFMLAVILLATAACWLLVGYVVLSEGRADD